jgi:tetratricopeptide (TPR) repeat protein
MIGLLGVWPLAGQRAPGTAGSSSGNASNVPTNTGTSTVGNNPGVPTSTRNVPQTGVPGNYPGQTVFLSGAVMFDDGSKPNIDIVLELVCNGSPHPQGHTDSKGHFSFQIGQNPEALDVQDASVGSQGGTPGMAGGPNFGTPGTTNNNIGLNRNGSLGSNSNPLMGCEIRARYPGFRSDSIELGSRRSLDDPNVGTIILHRLANVSGTTISATTAEAPKGARKEYEKGVQFVQKGKMEDAEKHLQQAVTAYPQYALAWFALGDLQKDEGHLDAAAASYKSAIGADAKYVSPYDRLALLAVQSGNWKDAESYSKQAISLNPVEFPTSFLYNAIASMNLKESKEAEESARALLKMDTAHHFPQAEDLLAQVLLAEGKNAEAATHIRAYLARYPNSKDAAMLQQALAKIDPASAVAKN